MERQMSSVFIKLIKYYFHEDFMQVLQINVRVI